MVMACGLFPVANGVPATGPRAPVVLLMTKAETLLEVLFTT
jgi:hypothetical protein